ncbi:MAG: hypothetical protein ACYS8W_12835 [Planctomycetota bacterium]|jgi:hypothetical protein
MKRLVLVSVVLALFIALVAPVHGGLKRDEVPITFAETYNGGLAEAKARGVPAIVIWPERG